MICEVWSHTHSKGGVVIGLAATPTSLLLGCADQFTQARDSFHQTFQPYYKGWQYTCSRNELWQWGCILISSLSLMHYSTALPLRAGLIHTTWRYQIFMHLHILYEPHPPLVEAQHYSAMMCSKYVTVIFDFCLGLPHLAIPMN